MKISLKFDYKIIKSWLWLWYPITVVLTIIVSATFILFGGANLWNKFIDRGQFVARQAKTLEIYQQKLTLLSQANQTRLDADLQLLTQAVPLSSQVWEVVNLARVTGEQTGASLTQWKAFGGEVASESAADTAQTMTGLFSVQNTQQLQALLDSLERFLPLVAVKRVSFSPQKTQIDLEGKWSPYSKVAPDANIPLPQDTATLLPRLRQTLSTFKTLPSPPPVSPPGQLGKDNPF